MIGLDTNVLLRAITADDPAAARRARQILGRLNEGAAGRVNGVVLAELAWTLRARYGYERSEIADIVEGLMSSPAIEVSDRDAVSAAITRSRDDALDFADALIGELNRVAGCDTTLTFDRKASRSSAFTLIA